MPWLHSLQTHGNRQHPREAQIVKQRQQQSLRPNSCVGFVVLGERTGRLAWDPDSIWHTQLSGIKMLKPTATERCHSEDNSFFFYYLGWWYQRQGHFPCHLWQCRHWHCTPGQDSGSQKCRSSGRREPLLPESFPAARFWGLWLFCSQWHLERKSPSF